LPTSTGGNAITYTWILAAGFLLSAIWLAIQPTQRWLAARARGADLIPAFATAFSLGLVGARLGFIIVNLHYFQRNPIESLWLWQGGLSGTGGVIGALVGIIGFSRLAHLPFKKLSDALAIPALVIAVCSWTGSWIEGSVYGIRLDMASPLLMAREMFGGLAARWPAPLIGLSPAIAVLLLLARTRIDTWKPGCQASLAGCAVGLGILLASLVRADPVPILFQLRLDTSSGIILTVAGLSTLLICYRGNKSGE
jgi:prolipoprotein diacylglyceryltransferase